MVRKSKNMLMSERSSNTTKIETLKRGLKLIAGQSQKEVLTQQRLKHYSNSANIRYQKVRKKF